MPIKISKRIFYQENILFFGTDYKDDNDPDLVGKIMVFKYGVKIFNKIMSKVNPEIGKPHIPFDLYTGKPLFLVVNKVGGYNNYDNSNFR